MHCGADTPRLIAVRPDERGDRAKHPDRNLPPPLGRLSRSWHRVRRRPGCRTMLATQTLPSRRCARRAFRPLLDPAQGGVAGVTRWAGSGSVGEQTLYVCSAGDMASSDPSSTMIASCRADRLIMASLRLAPLRLALLRLAMLRLALLRLAA